MLEGVIEAVDVRRPTKGRRDDYWVTCIRLPPRAEDDTQEEDELEEGSEVKRVVDIAEDDLSDLSDAGEFAICLAHM